MDFIVVYNIIYTKPEWCKDTSFAHLLVNHQKALGCEENEHCICYTLLEKKDKDVESLLVPLSDSVAIVIKNINLPKQQLKEERDEVKEEKEEKEVKEELL
jgi:hypothetical protein